MTIAQMKSARIAALLATLAASSLALSGCFALPNFGGGGDGGETTTSPETGGDAAQGGETAEGGEAAEGGDSFQNPETQDVFKISVGDCIADDSASGNDPAATEVYDVPIVPCSQPHAYEVYHDFNMPDQSTYPGDEAVSAAAEEGCTGQGFTDYIGKEFASSELYVYWYTPTPGSWAAGDRMVSCLVLEPAAETGGNPTSGSLKDSNR